MFKCFTDMSTWSRRVEVISAQGMHAGDFLLSTNILLSGNNYAKIALLLKFMNMRIVNQTTFFWIQDHFCIDPIKEFWDKKRKEIIV